MTYVIFNCKVSCFSLALILFATFSNKFVVLPSCVECEYLIVTSTRISSARRVCVTLQLEKMTKINRVMIKCKTEGSGLSG